MKLAVLGANGMLGTDIMSACNNAGISANGYDLPEIDITRDEGGLDKIENCDWVVNCAAYTDVDGAEKEKGKAFDVNRDGVRRIAGWCRRSGVSLLHISTDYVFDGKSKTAYSENSRVNPLNIYGMSKLGGEEEIKSSGINYIIARTQSLFGANGRNFVRTILSRLGNGPEPLKVVDDQVSSPTYTVHLSDAILRLLNTGEQGIVHVSSSGECTWYQFACAIAAIIQPGVKIIPVTSNEYVRPAKRPAYSVLDKTLYTSWTGHVMPPWEDGLKEYLERIRS
ncbi:MAG: dTDP-4-dehydrorhamnose reductase [Kiritimatiellae bacterium]|nr:dTDP-4-dehydrorhamnose reductase [Kiritimatiellia bacterium]MDD5523330.1 dTDP-4-dehydrorhamnose reductase [Kiritimatiellia bacterium]